MTKSIIDNLNEILDTMRSTEYHPSEIIVHPVTATKILEAIFHVEFKLDSCCQENICFLMPKKGALDDISMPEM